MFSYRIVICTIVSAFILIGVFTSGVEYGFNSGTKFGLLFADKPPCDNICCVVGCEALSERFKASYEKRYIDLGHAYQKRAEAHTCRVDPVEVEKPDESDIILDTFVSASWLGTFWSSCGCRVIEDSSTFCPKHPEQYAGYAIHLINQHLLDHQCTCPDVVEAIGYPCSVHGAWETLGISTMPIPIQVICQKERLGSLIVDTCFHQTHTSRPPND